MAGEPTIVAVGRLGSDPEIKFMADGKAFASFSLAVTPSSKVGDEWVPKETIWYRVTAWDGAEQIIETIAKGALVTVEGKFTIGSYESKTGEHKISYNITASKVEPKQAKAKVENDPW